MLNYSPDLSKYPDFVGLKDVVYEPGLMKKEEQVVVEVDPKYSDLMAVIYGVDPVTKLPAGDLAQYLSKETNVQIRDFIQNQLMQALEPEHTEKLSDDELVQFSRKSGESVVDYTSRMADYIRSDYMKFRESQTKDE